MTRKYQRDKLHKYMTKDINFDRGGNSKNNNTTRATSPGHHSGIPTPGGKAIPTRSSSAAEKQLNRTSASSTSSTSSTKSNPGKPANKNSMLDKFKFFNSKEKDKKGGVKSSSKKSASSSNAKSESDSSKDTKSSTSPRSSSSFETGASTSSSNNGPNSPKLPAKSGKKSLVRAFSTKRETPKTLAPEENGKKRNTPSPGSQQPRTPSPNTNIPLGPGAPPPVPKTSPPPSRKNLAKAEKVEKPSKSGTLIPKSSSGKFKSAASTPTSSQIPAPNFAMPKSSSKSGKSSKEEKSKSSKESSKASSSLQGASSSKISKGHSLSSPASTPDGSRPMSPIVHSNSNHSGMNHATRSSQENSSNYSQSQQARVYAQDNNMYYRVEHGSGVANPHSNAHAPTDQMNMVSKSSRTPKSQIVIPSARGMHGGATMTQTVNVVKPQCTMAPTRSVSKADGNTQTNLSVMQKTINTSKYAVPRDSSNHNSHTDVSYSKPSDSVFASHMATPVHPQSPSMAERVLNTGLEKCSPRDEPTNISTSLSSSQSSNTSGSVSSNDSVIQKPGVENSTYDRLMSSSSNSPRLGVKMLGKPANNVAIVQPRHGEKMETTFDREVRTEKVNQQQNQKNLSGKETTFSEKSTTFVDDCGETMDIKPMPPIMRALPYGYFRGYTGYTGLSSNRNFHIPGISVPPTQAMYASSGSRLGVNRPILEHPKFYSGQIKRSGSNAPSINNDPDYASDVDTYDYVSGYMSDGDILKTNNRVDDWSSGYMSEGGASLYARRLQQRFREGMQAVKDCMQKSSGVIDDDRSNSSIVVESSNEEYQQVFQKDFDDSSSISSGDISDTIAEISTDENLTGSGPAPDNNPYSSLKRGPKDLTQGIHVSNGHSGRIQGKQPNLGTSAFLAGNYNNSDSSPYGWGRKYYIPQNSKLLSSDPSDYAYPYNNNCDQQSQWGRSEPGYGSLRKLSNASQSDYGYSRSERGDSPHHYAASDKGTYSPAPSVKCDSTTNTDQSHLMETSLKRMQTARGAAPSGGSGTGIQYRRPLSNVSNSSGGSNKSNGSGGKGSTAVGSRLAKHGVDNTPSGIPRPGSAAAKLSSHADMGPEAYASSTLERKKKGLTTSKSSSHAVATDFQSNTLGRRRLFDSKGSLAKGQNGENGSMCPSTIISNPHATYGKVGGQQSHYVNLQQLQALQQQCTLQQNSPASGNYITLEYSSPRNSGNNWLLRNGNGVMSETESMDSISSATSMSIQAQIQQARALSGASARILAQQRDQTSNQNQDGFQRSDSIKSTHSDVALSRKKSLPEELPRTNSFSQLSSPCNSAAEQLASPSSLHASSRFTYPMTFTSGMPSNLSHHMVHSNTHHGMIFNSLPLTKASRDEDGISRKS
ncbi:hypothetical protein LOTGIDRAFT_168331 [Lottia gigantea]|uniref:Uncharacterized protein n=1 Tax=Lottia gigantea TaxID=225164 RepID=V3ZKR2_LOTGI|nr:hypothetical protein LOTGIDRAFT_168331 [Lottia gigantea]ESO84842.1 hypothetical protein LOTGIDRAFT_168331 [Lottia gigantea]